MNKMQMTNLKSNNNIMKSDIQIFNDEYNIEKCKILFCLEDDVLLKYTNHTQYKEEENKYYIKKIKNTLKQLILNESNTIKREYNQKGCNRIYAKGGLQYFSNDILHFILPENSCEYDLKNCNPKIFLYLFKKHDLPYKNLEYYCNNRDDLLKNSNLTKLDVLKNINRDFIKKKNIEWFDDLIEEISNNKAQLFSFEVDKVNNDYRGKKKNEPNFLSSMCCAICWFYENEILQKAITKYKCIIPRFDGFLSDELIDINELNELSKEYDLKWDIKKISSIIKEDSYDENKLNDLLYDKNSLQYDAIEYHFNKEHFKIIEEGLFIMKNNDIYLKMLNTKQMIENYKHISYEVFNEKKGIMENKCFIDRWIKANPNMIVYDKMDYYPDGNVPDNCYNLWTKFDVEVIDNFEYIQDDLDFILNHIKILCGNDDKVYDFVIKYIAHLFYKPQEKIGKMLIFASIEGIGKGLFYKLISNMIGKRFYSCSDPQKSVLGTFNSSLLNSYIINFEELDYFSTKDSQDILKNLITETELEVNAKNKDPKMIKSIHRFIGNTNHVVLPIKLSPTDRRFLIIRCSDEKCGDSDYFKNLYKLVMSKDTQATFYKYLSTIDITDFISEKIPETEYLNELKNSFESPLLDFIKEIVCNSKLDKISELSNKLFNDFREYLNYNNMKICLDWSIRKFGLEMNELIKKMDNSIERLKKSGKNYYIIDCNKINSKYSLCNTEVCKINDTESESESESESEL